MLGAPLVLVRLHDALARGAPGKDPKRPTDNLPVGRGKLLLEEDFESTSVGEIPADLTKIGAVAVVDDTGHSGRHSLRIGAATHGPRRITTRSPALAALGGHHWGRLFFKVRLPTPDCDKGVIPSTLVSGTAQSPLHQEAIEVGPLDTILSTQGSFGHISNVQSHNRPEFA